MIEQTAAARLLVVEDDHSLAQLYAEWLGDRYDIEPAHDGTEALERIDESVDVVLLDRRLPGPSGGEILEAIRDSGADPRVVMISAVTPDLEIVQMGFDAYLEKPVDAAALRETVERMLSRAEYDEKLQELFSLIERQNTLEAVKKPAVLENSEEYHLLTERLERVQTEVESLLTGLPEEDFQIAVEQVRRTATERRSDRRYESLTEDVLDGLQEATVVVDAEGSVVWANEVTETLLGLDRSRLQGREYATVAAEQLGEFEAGEESLASLIEAGLADHQQELQATVHVPGEEGRPERWLEYRGAPVETGLYAGGRIERYHEITGRYRREQYLQTLHRATRELMAAETPDRVVDQAVTTATAALDFPYAAVFTREDQTGDLVPAAREAGDTGADPTLPTLSQGHDPVWTTFTERPERLDAATWDGDGGGWLEESFDDWLLCPLGQEGVFLVGTAEEVPLSETERNLAETWAANTCQALEQISRTRNLRDRDRKLRQQNERLSRLDRVNQLIRSISPAVVSADTRAEVETEVCRRLLRIDPVTAAWIADVDMPTDGTVCRASAGDIDGYLSGVPQAVSDGGQTPLVREAPAAPARRAHETGSSVTVTDLLGVDPGSWWRDRSLQRGTHAIVAVPIVHESARFGALEVHVDRPQGMGEREIEALEELGVIIGHGIGAIRKRDALLSGGATSLRFRVRPESTLSRFAAEVDTPLTATDISTQDDGTCEVFVTLDLEGRDDCERVRDRAEASPGVSVLRDDTTRMTCEVTLGVDSPVQAVVGQGVALRQIETRPDPEGLTVTVALPHSTDVRDYVDDVTGALDGVELVAKYDQPDGWQPESVSADVDDRLTDRQRETLQIALHAGYFDWPRSADAETVAAELGIAQSTFSQHLRTAQRKVFEQLFL